VKTFGLNQVCKVIRIAMPLAALLLSACLGSSVITITTPTTYSIGGTINGLSGTVVLQNNGGDNLTLSTNGNFVFATNINDTAAYHVSVLTQPAGQLCSVSTGVGTVAGINVNSVVVSCASSGSSSGGGGTPPSTTPATYSIGGTINGLSGTVVLQNNSGDNLALSTNGNFVFATSLNDTAAYSVSVLTQPAAQLCSVSTGVGTVTGINVNSIVVSCTGWANVKFGGGGYVPGLIFHPTVPNVLYARTDVAGAYRWDSANSTWIPITDMFGFNEGQFQGVESIALDPTDANKVYLVGGMYVTGGNARLYKSSDQGTTWTYVNLPFPAGGNNAGRAIGERLMVDPNMPSVMFYASRSQGLWKSTDSGATWNQVSFFSYHMTGTEISNAGNSPIGIEGVVFDTAVPPTGFVSSGTSTQTIYVSVAPDYMASGAGLTYYMYKSIDGGTNWTGIAIPSLVTTFTNAWQTTPIKPYIPHMVRDTDTTTNRKFYVVFAGGTGPGAGGPAWLYSFDGTNWSAPLKSTAPAQYTSFGFGGVSVYGTGASTRIALGETNSWGGYAGMPVVAYSKDAGATWTEIADNRTASGWIDDVEINPFNPDNVLHDYGGGVWSTSNASNATPSWTQTVDGIEELATRSLMTPPPGASYLLVAGYWDVGTQVHTNVNTKPTTNIPAGISFGNGNGTDTAWTNPAYIAAIGSTNGNSGNTSTVGIYSTDSGVTWTGFATMPPFAPAGANVDQGGSGEANIAVTAPGNLVWAPSTASGNVTSNGVPYYTTNNGATWTATNLPPPTQTSINNAYHLAADRKNPSKVYAYDGGGARWTNTNGKFYYSTDGGKTFTQSTDATLAGLSFQQWGGTWLAVNPNAEGDVWLTNGDNVYHSTDSGVSWTKLTTMASTPAGYNHYNGPTFFGAQRVALGKPVAGSSYSAAVYLVGTVGGVAGLFRSDDAGSTWTRINDDAHQWGGIGALAADNNVAGRVYLAGRGVLYNY
jgi:hypothetical protein